MILLSKARYKWTQEKKKNPRCTVTPIENERLPAPGIWARSSQNKVTVGRFCKLDYGQEERARCKTTITKRDLSRGGGLDWLGPRDPPAVSQTVPEGNFQGRYKKKIRKLGDEVTVTRKAKHSRSSWQPAMVLT